MGGLRSAEKIPRGLKRLWEKGLQAPTFTPILKTTEITSE